MKKAIFWSSAVVLLAGVLTLGRIAWSQNQESTKPTPSNLPHKIGLIDMAHVFKHYKKFEILREDLKAELTESEEKAKGMQKDIVDKQAQLKALQEGVPAYTQLEQEIVKKMAEFESFRRSGQRDFLKKEANIYLQVYNETSDAVKKYADYFKYTLIIRFNREDLDTENPSALLNGMNRQVVYHHPEDDITISVLDYLNKQYGRTQPGSTAPPAIPKTAVPPAKTDKK